MTHHMSIDIETYSSVPIAKAGLYKYAESPDFELLLFAYSWDGGPVEKDEKAYTKKAFAKMLDKDVVKHAYNAAFEWYCLSRYFNMKLPVNQWRDTMLHALYCGYPASLESAGAALGLAEDKRKLQTGKALIRTFCTPRTPTARDTRTRVNPQDEPDKWTLFKDYNAQDVVSETAIDNALSAWPVPEQVQKQWEQDVLINARGIAVDIDMVTGALACSDIVTSRLTEEARTLTGLENPNSVPQLSTWLQQETGMQITDLRKESVSELLTEDLPGNKARRALEIRQDLSKTSTKKYDTMLEAACSDNRIRGTLQFYGACRSGRWAGRLIQVQNLPRTYLHGKVLDLARQLTRDRKPDDINMLTGSVPDVLSQLIRTALIPSPGCIFVDADFSAIEARVIAWLAGEEWVLNVFRTHGKIYEACASQMFGVPIDKIVKGNPEYSLRQKGKVATLALGYQGSTGALIAMGALRMGIPEEDLPDIVHRWRDSNRRIVDLWYALENAALDTVQTGRINSTHGLTFALEGDGNRCFMTIRLPSGRKLFYSDPCMGTNRFGSPSLTYKGQNQTTRKWETLETYGGKLVENCVQAIARDCLAEKLTQLESAGYDIVFHVHDEVILEVKTQDPNAELARV